MIIRKTLLVLLFTLFTFVSCSSGRSGSIGVVASVFTDSRLDPSTPRDSQNFKLYILHTNDVSGYVNEGLKNDDTINFETFAGFVDAVRKYDAHTILLDAGNFSYGTRMAEMNSGRDMYQLAKLAGYNAMTVGDQDMRVGVDNLVSNVRYGLSKSDNYTNDEVYYVSQNLRGTARQTPWDKFKIFNIDGFKIGVIGLTSPNLSTLLGSDDYRGYRYQIDYRDLQRDINSVRRVVNYVILLSNVGCSHPVDNLTADDSDERKNQISSIYDIMKELKNVDLVIDCSPKTVFPSSLEDDPEANPHHFRVVDKAGKKINVVSADRGLKSVGLVMVSVAEGRVDGEPLFENIPAVEINNPSESATMKRFNIDQTPGLTTVKGFVDSRQITLDETDGEAIAFLPFTFNGDAPTTETSRTNLGDTIAESLKNSVSSEISIFPSGCIKDSLPSGEVTNQDVFKCFPCNDTILRVSMTGSQIWDVLEYGLSNLPDCSGKFPQTNMNIEVNPNAEVGAKVISVTLQDGTVVEKSNAETFTVAILDSMIQGIEGYTQFSSRNAIPGGIAWEAFAAQLSESYPIN